MRPVPEPASALLRRLDREATAGPWRDATLGGLLPGEGKILALISGDGDDWRPVAYFCDVNGQGEASDVEHDRPLIATLRNALPALADLVASVEQCCATNCPEARQWQGVSIAACNCSHCTSLAALRERLGAKP